MEWEGTSSQTHGPVPDDSHSDEEGRKVEPVYVLASTYRGGHRWPISLPVCPTTATHLLGVPLEPGFTSTLSFRMSTTILSLYFIHWPSLSLTGAVPFSLSIPQPSPPAVSLRVRRPRRRHTFVISHLYLSPLYPISPNALKAARPLIPPY